MVDLLVDQSAGESVEELAEEKEVVLLRLWEEEMEVVLEEVLGVALDQAPGVMLEVRRVVALERTMV